LLEQDYTQASTFDLLGVPPVSKNKTGS